MVRLRYQINDEFTITPQFVTYNNNKILTYTIWHNPLKVIKIETINNISNQTPIDAKSIAHAKKLIKQDLIKEGIVFTSEVRQRKPRE